MKLFNFNNIILVQILLDENQDLNKASNVIHSLMGFLCLTADDLIAEEYIDLLETYKYNIKVNIILMINLIYWFWYKIISNFNVIYLFRYLQMKIIIPKLMS